MVKKYQARLESKLDRPLTRVPPSYICNRCKGRGHFVCDCPTNEDPFYDMPAGFDYVCKYCGEQGTHYYIFCPRNPDPNSIYRRRQAKGLLPSGSSLTCQGMKRPLAPFSKPPTPPTAFRATTTPQDDFESPKSPTPEFKRFARVKRISSREGFSGWWLTKNNSTNKIGSGKSSATIEDAKGKTPGGNGSPAYSFGFPHIEMTLDLTKSPKTDRNGSHSSSDALEQSEGDIVWERLKNEIEKEFFERQESTRIEKQSRTFIKRTPTKQTATQQIASVTARQLVGADFLNKLFENHPSQPGPKRRPRMTDIEMWDISNVKRRRGRVEKSITVEQSVAIEYETPSNNEKKKQELCSHTAMQDWADMEVDGHREHLERSVGWTGFIIGSEGFSNGTVDMEEIGKEHTQAEKLKAIQNKLQSIDGLRVKLASWGEIESFQMEKMVSGDLSQEEIDEISMNVRSK